MEDRTAWLRRVAALLEGVRSGLPEGWKGKPWPPTWEEVPAEDLLAAYFCAVDHKTPTYVRAVLCGAVAYFVLPADLVPDVLAPLGFTDDASVIAAALAAVGSHLRPHHRDAARARLDRLAG